MCAIAYAKHKCPLAKGSLAPRPVSRSRSDSAVDSDIWQHSGACQRLQKCIGELIPREGEGAGKLLILFAVVAANKIMRNPQNMLERASECGTNCICSASPKLQLCFCNGVAVVAGAACKWKCQVEVEDVNVASAATASICSSSCNWHDPRVNC